MSSSPTYSEQEYLHNQQHDLARVKRQVGQAFRLQGLQLTGGALSAILSILNSEAAPGDALASIVNAIKDRMERKELASTVIDEAIIASVSLDLSNTEDDLARASLDVISAFGGSRLAYDPLRKTLKLEQVAIGSGGGGGSVLHAGPDARAVMLRERLLLVQQRAARHDLFRPPVIANSKRDYLKLTLLDSLLGSHGTKCVLGMLTQPSEGQYALEDLTCQVPIDLSRAHYTPGIFTESCIVVAEGEIEDGVFRVNMMGFPPPEFREGTSAALGQPDLFGTGLTPHQLQRLGEMEVEAQNSLFIILSDVHLDKPAVMEKLRLVFQGFSQEACAPLFVLMGDFSSAPMNHTADSIAQAAANFDALGSLIAEFPQLAAEATFVLVPGPNDPTIIGGMALPRGPLPSHFVRGVTERAAHVHLATSPCRLRFYTHEVVLFREDIVKKMQRHAIVPPRNPPDAPNMDISEHLVKTLLDQGHLCPLPLPARPIHPQFDASLRLYPLPHLVVLADYTDQYQWRYHDEAWAVNPGSFPSDYAFVVYRPASGEVEFSRCS